MNREKSMTSTRRKLLTKLSSLPNQASRSNYIDSHPRLVCPTIVEQIADAVREDVRVDVKRAQALAETAVVIAEKLHDEESLARALRAKWDAL